MTTHTDPHRVVITGAGIAGLEALLALRVFAGPRVALTLLAPHANFSIAALSVRDPFAPPATRHYPLDLLCEHVGAQRCEDVLETVDVERRQVRTSRSGELPYDSLLVAVGAKTRHVYPFATPFRGRRDVEAIHALLQGVEHGVIKRLAFVVPPSVAWTLPLYELALLTAARVDARGLSDVELMVLTPEPAPLEQFGRRASGAVADTLVRAGITVHCDVHVDTMRGRTLCFGPGARSLDVDGVVALPERVGRRVPGLPSDADGFLTVDAHGRVAGVPHVYAAGDGAAFHIKQGGLAAQQADAAAQVIAQAAGADVVPRPFEPRLRGKLLTGEGGLYLRNLLAGSDAEHVSTASDHALWWPPTKVASRFLAPYLHEVGRYGSDGHTAAEHVLLGR
jgi:sulfide:quinone oxidoreductase